MSWQHLSSFFVQRKKIPTLQPVILDEFEPGSGYGQLVGRVPDWGINDHTDKGIHS